MASYLFRYFGAVMGTRGLKRFIHLLLSDKQYVLQTIIAINKAKDAITDNMGVFSMTVIADVTAVIHKKPKMRKRKYSMINCQMGMVRGVLK